MNEFKATDKWYKEAAESETGDFKTGLRMTSESKYQCKNCPDHGYCDLESKECLRAYCERYDRMLDYLKKIAESERYLNEFYKKLDIKEPKEISMKTNILLREIGEI
jgi:hypothetical protein